MREIKGHSGLLALHLQAEDLASEGSHFFCRESDFIQLASHRYGAGKAFTAHQHHPSPRVAERTQEVLILLSGSLKADIYDHDRSLAESFTIKQGEVIVLLDGGHGFTALSEGACFLELKNGPYPGAEKDRFRLFQ